MHIAHHTAFDVAMISKKKISNTSGASYIHCNKSADHLNDDLLEGLGKTLKILHFPSHKALS